MRKKGKKKEKRGRNLVVTRVCSYCTVCRYLATYVPANLPDSGGRDGDGDGGRLLV